MARFQLLPLRWTENYTRAVLDIQERLKHAVKTVHRDRAKTLCLNTDASDCFWSGLLTQCAPEDLNTPLAK